ncbi:MAG: hypothetical protein ABIS36_16595 [Chryseolinea sp.]
MKRVYILLFAGLTLTVITCKRDDRYAPDKYLSEEAQKRLIRESVYYSTKLPPNGSEETKFSSEFDWYYDAAAQETELLKYYKSDDGIDYFLVGREARSINPMREGIGGKVKYDAAGKMTEYEEIFRTWKLVDDTLTKRGSLLFDRMVRGNDLTMYYSKFQGDRYIEFPDGRYYFDKVSRHWLNNELDSMKLN